MNRLAVALAAAAILTVGGIVLSTPAFASTSNPYAPCHVHPSLPASAETGDTVIADFMIDGDCAGDTVQYQLYDANSGYPVAQALPMMDVSGTTEIQQDYQLPAEVGAGAYNLEAVAGTMLTLPFENNGDNAFASSTMMVSFRPYTVLSTLTVLSHSGTSTNFSGRVTTIDDRDQVTHPQQVILQVKMPNGYWYSLQASSPDSHGTAQFYGINSYRAQTYRVLPDFYPANTTLNLSTIVVPQAALTPTNLRINAATRSGGTVSFKGNLTYPFTWSPADPNVSITQGLVGARVQLQRYVGGKWVTVSTITATVRNDWNLTAKVTAPASKWRFLFPGNATYRAATSPSVTK